MARITSPSASSRRRLLFLKHALRRYNPLRFASRITEMRWANATGPSRTTPPPPISSANASARRDPAKGSRLSQPCSPLHGET